MLRWLTSEAADLQSITFLKSGRTAEMPGVWVWANANNNKAEEEYSENNRQADTPLPPSKNFRKN